MSRFADIREFITRQTKGLGSLFSASVIVVGVLAFAVYSASAGSSEDRMQRAAQEASRRAQEAIAASGRVSQLYLSASGLQRPVSYLAEISIHGWKNRGECVIDASVYSVEVLDGEAIQVDEDPTGSVADALAEQLTGKRVLASVDPRIAAEMPEDGNAQVRLIVAPQGDTATLVIDEVLRPVHLIGAGTFAGATADPRSTGAASVAAKANAKGPSIVGLSTYVSAPGTTVTIYGRNFGSSSRGNRVTCVGVRASVVRWSDRAIEFKVPSGIARSGCLGVVVRGVSSNGVYFVPFAPPAVTSISPRQGAPGTVVSITGKNFGAERAGWVTFAGSSASVVSWSDTRIDVLVPRGVTAGYAGVIAHGMTSNGILYAPYGAPLVTWVSDDRLAPGDTVTLRGSDFGVAPGVVVLGGVLLSASELEQNAVTFTVPENVRSGYAGVVLKSGVTSNGVWERVAPRLESLSAGWATPGSAIAIRGKGFGGSQGGYTVYVGGVPAQVDSWGTTEIVARVPNAAASGYVGVGTPAACSNGIYLPIGDPGHVADVAPSDVRPGEHLTVTGTGFGNDRENRNVLLAGTECEAVSWSDSAIEVVVPASARSGYIGIGQDRVTSNGVWVNVRP